MMTSPSPTPAASPIVMSGMRSTGFLHLGHYLGVLKNWVRLQEEGHRCFFMTADWHGLTTKFASGEDLSHWRREMVIDWLAAGLDPDKVVIYAQSQVPEIAELHLLLSMVTPNKWCETDPTLKDMVALLRNRSDGGESSNEGGDLTYGLLGYPVLQTADILAMGGSLVPVGKDQLAHLEISRDIARRFNHLASQGGQAAIFAEPRPLLTEAPAVQGLDGRKMSKSYNNGIYLSDSEDATIAKIKAGLTDTQRIKKTDAGDVARCTGIYPWYELLTDVATCAVVAEECAAAARGCMACKLQLAEALNEQLRPLRERRLTWAAQPKEVDALLRAGSQQAREQAAPILAAVRSVYGL